MLMIKDESVIVDYCIFRQRKFIQTPCKSCNYRNTKTEDCVFDPQPWTLSNVDKQEDLLLDCRNSITKTDRNEMVDKLLLEGYSMADISKKLKLKYGTVNYIVQRSKRIKAFKENFPEFYEAAKILKMDEGLATKVVKMLHGRSRSGKRFVELWPDVNITDISESAYAFGPKMQLLMDTAKSIRERN